jgi:tetratricopeptide (TPR) repeat protein
MLLLAGVAAIVLGIWIHHRTVHPGPVAAAPDPPLIPPEQQVFATYAGSASCRDCHRSEYERWAPSHHGLAERTIRPELDKPAFDPPRTFHHGSQTSDVRISGDAYQIVTVGLSKKMEPQTIARVIGVDPVRQFLVDVGHGRLQTLEAAYDPNQKDWFNVYGSEDRQPGEWGHWTGRGMTWNMMCAACHNTRVRKNYDEAADSYHTSMAEMSVSCEACHGPMKEHAQWQQADRKSGRKDPALSRPSRDQILDTCGSCHARRGELLGDFFPGQSFFDHYTLEGVNETELFYPDGQVHDEDYEFSAFLGSKMHAAGVRCIDCHDAHSGKTLLDGNALCMKCHAAALPAFPKAPPINLATHTFHKFDSTGSQCINCHMPQTTYMQRHVRHDHGFTIPDPLLTKKTGTPNACNRCHKDKDVDWALAAADKWYGAKLDRPSRQRALTIAAGRRGDDSARGALLALLDDPAQTFYWKAGFVRLLGRWSGEPSVTSALMQQCKADHPMVREPAATELGPLAGREDVARLLKGLLSDPSRNVRIAAASALGNQLDAKELAARESVGRLHHNADQPVGQFQLAVYEAVRQKPEAAVVHLEKALAWDPRSASLRSGAATFYAELGRPQTALEQIREAARLEPNNSEYQLLLGMGEAEARHDPEALAALEKSVQLDPNRARAWYNLALARTHAGQIDASLDAYAKAEALDPKDADIPYGLATLLEQLNRPVDAIAAARRALQIRPDYAPAAKLIRELSR